MQISLIIMPRDCCLWTDQFSGKHSRIALKIVILCDLKIPRRTILIDGAYINLSSIDDSSSGTDPKALHVLISVLHCFLHELCSLKLHRPGHARGPEGYMWPSLSLVSASALALRPCPWPHLHVCLVWMPLHILSGK